ncbi:MAG: hypothetical protein PHQ74_12790 [Crocinitomicaceae bacterium]|nr:hypothetical protein [Crocinitomicaceae bacterium]
MREELLGPKVEGVAVAVVKQIGEDNATIYNVYLVNLREDIIEGIIITSEGFGVNVETGEKIKTSSLRHSMELMLPNEAAKIEPIMEEVFGMTNQYWVSFWINDTMYDKKYIFLPETIQEKNMKMIPSIGLEGVIIE